MTLPRLVRPLALLGACLLTAAAWAHTSSVLDLEAVEGHVAARMDETAGDPALHTAYRKLDAKLGRTSRKKLAKDVAKLQAVAASLAGPLAPDAELRVLLSADADETDGALDEAKNAAALELAKIARVKHRVRVQAVIDKGDAAAAEGRILRDSANEAPALAAFKESAKQYAAAVALSKRLRNSNSFPQFKASDR